MHEDCHGPCAAEALRLWRLSSRASPSKQRTRDGTAAARVRCCFLLIAAAGCPCGFWSFGYDARPQFFHIISPHCHSRLIMSSTTSVRRKTSSKKSRHAARKSGSSTTASKRAATRARSAYQELIKLVRDANLMASTAAVLSWDQETMMPPGGVQHRSNQLAQLARLSHEMATSPRIGELLEECEADDRLLRRIVTMIFIQH